MAGERGGHSEPLDNTSMTGEGLRYRGEGGGLELKLTDFPVEQWTTSVQLRQLPVLRVTCGDWQGAWHILLTDW